MKIIIIDVRTEKEFAEGTYPGAINIPLAKLEQANLLQFSGSHIALLCNSGNRAEKAKKVFIEAGLKQVSLLQNQMTHIIESTQGNSQIWTIDRQFRLALGVLIGISIVSNLIFFSTASIMLLIILFSGLLFSAITDNCYLKELITIMPWNRKPTINHKEISSDLVVEPSL
jgi:rhodanese-related sulfurtransferase